MMENIDIIISSIVDLIIHNEIIDANNKIEIYLRTLVLKDFESRQKQINQISINIRKLSKIIDSIESSINKLPENLQIHAYETMRDTMEDIKHQIIKLQNQKNILARPSSKY